MRFEVTLAIAGLALSPAFAQQAEKPSKPQKPAKAEKPAKMEKEEQPFKGKTAQVHFDSKHLIWRIGNDAAERTVQFDKVSGSLKTLRVRVPGGKAMVAAPSEGQFQVSAAGKMRTIGLDKDWVYSWQTSTVTAQGGKRLSIHLQGVGSNHGYEAEATYEVYPGNRPYMEKDLTLINRTNGTITVTGATLDQWVLGMDETPKAGKGAQAPAAGTFSGGKETGMIVDAASQHGAAAMVMGGTVSYEGGGLVQRFKGSMIVENEGGRAYMPKAVFFAFHGTAATGSDLMARYGSMGDMVARK